MRIQFLLIPVLIYCLLFSLQISAQTCLPGQNNFFSQSQIDNFQINNPNCTEVEGDVHIFGDNINNLDGLNVLNSIWGSLYITYTNSLKDLSGIENIDSIGGNLYIGNPDSRKGCGNDSLINLNGLNNLSYVGGDFYIGFNELLVNVEGLHNLTSISGDFIIEGNDLLPHLSGLENLNSISGNLEIGCIHVFRLPYCIGNSSLKNLEGLSGLSTINGNLSILCNDSLTSITAIENLSYLGGDIAIGYPLDYSSYLLAGNPMLLSLKGLKNIEAGSIDNIFITHNNSLNDCAAQSVCDYLSNINSYSEIHDNAAGCNTLEEVIQMCDSIQTPIQEFYNYNTFNISPNPCSGFANIQFAIKEQGFAIVDLFNISGLKIISLLKEVKMPGTYEMEIDLSNIPKGIYFCVLKTNQGIQTKKIIIL